MTDNEEIRVNMPTYLDKWAERIWDRFADDVRAADSVEGYVADKLSMLDPKRREIDAVAQELKHRVRESAPPAIKQTKRGIYK